MIELKDVTTQQDRGQSGLVGYSRIFRDGDFCQLDAEEGGLVIRAILGFLPVSEGYVCYDGMPLDERSVTFLRKLVAYIPKPDGFENAEDLPLLQLKMVEKALRSDAVIILAVDPVSHQDEATSRRVMGELRRKAETGRIVIIAN